MTRFNTRKVHFDALQPLCPQTSYTLHSDDEQLQFRTSSSARLLVRPSAGASPCRRQRCQQAVFCSVTASAAGSAPASFSSRRGKDASTTVSADRRDDAATKASATPSSLERLPVAIKKGEQLLPYVWDGRRISAMDEAALRDSDVNTGRLRNWLLGLQRRLRDAFLPDPRDVTPDYWEWLRWRLSQRFFSTTMQNFSFSALLMATGLGAKKAFAASAAINWLLKDGVSRIVRMSVATSFGQTFDADLKRMRFITSLIFTACMAGEFATPFWPQHFVALASISSVGKAVGLSAFVAVQPAFQASLATGGNLADLTSKNQAQHMVMDMLALGVSAGLTWLCRAMPRGGLLLPAIMYPVCAAGDLTCIWRELKAVQLRSLNRERAEMVIERWMRRGGQVPSAAEISDAERLVLPSEVWGGLMPLRITALDAMAPADPARLRQLLRQYEGEQYVMALDGPAAAAAGARGSGGSGGGGAGGGGWLRLPWLSGGEGPRVLVAFSDRATPNDIAKALLHAAYLRKAVLEHCGLGLREPRLHHHKQPHAHGHAHARAHSHGDPHAHPHTEALPLPLQHQLHSAGVAQGSGRSHEAAGSGSGSSGGAVGGGGGGCGCGSVGHSHEHVHWDAQRHCVYHHTHFHTHGPGSADHPDAHPHNHHSHHRRGHSDSHNHGNAHSHHSRNASSSSGSSSNGSGSGSGSNGWASGGGGDGGGSGEGGGDGGGGGGTWPGAAPRLQRHDSAGSLAGGVAPVPVPGACAAGVVGSRAAGAVGGDSGSGSRRHGGGGGVGAVVRPRWEEIDERTWSALLDGSRREAAKNLPRLVQQLEEADWRLRPFMLSTSERVQFVRV